MTPSKLATQLLLAGLASTGFVVALRTWGPLQASSTPTAQPHPPASTGGVNNNAAQPGPPAILVGAGDIAECRLKEDTLTAQLIAQIPGTVFTAGDNAYPSGTTEEFQQCYGPTWGQFKARTYPSPGNHDYGTPNAAPYYAYFGDRAGPVGKGYYSYTLGQWHIVSLNSNIDAQKGSAQEQWLRADLTAHPRACTLAYWHHPLFSSGMHGNNSKMKDIWDALAEFKADVVVTGHDHNYERFAPQTSDGTADPQGIRSFVVGTGGASLRPYNIRKPNSEVIDTETYGAIKFTLRSQSYDWAFIPIKGQTFTDKGTGICNTAKKGP